MVTSQILRGDKMLNIPTRKLYLHCSLYNIWRVDNTWGEVKGKVSRVSWGGRSGMYCHVKQLLMHCIK
jgi:hypothetical protein